MDRVAAIVPARYASSRFPGKVLAKICGKYMIQHVYEKAQASKADVVMIAADDEKVEQAVQSFGGKVVMTALSHQSGTDRIYEAMTKSGEKIDIVINVQGDEPLIPVSVIDELIDVMVQNPDLPMATVAVKGNRNDLADPNKVKVVFGANNMALYFSRSMIPYLREGGVDAEVYLHWGIYAYRAATLEKFVNLAPSKLEQCEKLEQLRALENGIGIYVHLSDLESVGVDTPDDLEKAEAKMKEQLKNG